MHLLRADGTIPIYYQGVKYNIPLKMYLPEGFPRVAPMCFVAPTAEMIVKPGHAIVDASGLVRGAFLDEWRFDRGSQLADLAARLSDAFGRDPPLFAKPTTGSGAAANQNQNPNPGGGGSSDRRTQRTGGREDPNASGRPNRPPPPPPPPPPLYPAPPPGVGGAPARSYPEVPGAAAAAERAAANARRPSPYPAPPPGVGGTPSGGGGGGLFGSGGGSSRASGAGGYQQYNRVPFSAAEVSSGGGGAGAAAPRRDAHPVSSGGGGMGGGARGLAEATFKSRAVASLTRALKAELAAVQTRCASEAERLLGVQAELADRRAALDAGLGDARRARSEWEGKVSALRAATVALTEWLAENERKPKPREGVTAGEGTGGEGCGADSDSAEDVEEAFAAEDVISAQLLRAAARDAALEDALDSLDEAHEKGRVPLEEYLDLTRNLCKEQFMARAEVLVVRKAQRERGVVGGVAFE